MTLCFSSVIGWRFGWSSRVFLIPDLCGEGSVVPVARGWGGGNAPRDPKPNFHGKIEEANALRASGWTLSLLVLSLNRIGLVIISWTRLRPFFNLSWRAGQIKRAAVAAFGPRNLCHFFSFSRRLLFYHNTSGNCAKGRGPVEVLTLTDGLPFQRSRIHICRESWWMMHWRTGNKLINIKRLAWVLTEKCATHWKHGGGGKTHIWYAACYYRVWYLQASGSMWAPTGSWVYVHQ